jgi:signal transduction histidine kinase
MPTFRRPELALLLQAILIALPVAVLAGGALHLLHNDRTVEQEVRDNARAVAPGLARKLGGALLSRQQEAQSQGEIVDGQVKLPGFPNLPEPADWPGKLTAQQAQWWKTAQDAIYRQPDAGVSQEAARRALSALAASAPANSPARANAELELLELGDWFGDNAFHFAEQFPQEVTSSGTPVAALALLLALQHTRAGTLPEHLMQAVETNTVDHPSFLTPELLEAAQQAAAGGMYAGRVAILQQRWQLEEASREKTLAALRTLMTRPLPADRPGEIWLDVGHDGEPDEGSQSLLALTNPAPGGRLGERKVGRWDVTLVPETSLVAALQETLRSTGGLPEYAGAVVEIGGQRRRLAGASAAGADPPLLASADGKLIANIWDDAFAPHTFRLDLDLSASYQQRRRLIQWIIFSAAGTALIGLVTLWTGHRRQARLNEMKSNFVSSVSHELRAPIAAVQLMAESLESGRVTGESRQQDYYHLIVQECRRLSTLVGNVLDFSRIDQGRQRYRFEPVDPMALLRHSVMLMQPYAEQRRVRLVLSESRDAPPEAVDHPQPAWDREAVEQSLVNLLDNAIKHSPEGAEVRVEMETCRDTVRLWVRDRGPGIPAADHARIFERFYRAGQELRRETKGVGIGLSIVKHVAEGHRGRVLVESVVGQGSSFGLELPLNGGTAS